MLSELTESSLCHLELACKAVFICAHRSFLQDFDLFVGAEGGGNRK